MVSSRSLRLEFQPAYCWTTLSSVVPFNYDIRTINMYLLSTGNTSRSKDAESPSWCDFIFWFYYILFNKILHKHHLPLEMLIYQGSLASQGCQKNIFRQNSSHTFAFLLISNSPWRASRSLDIFVFLYTSGGICMRCTLDLCIADEDEPSHVSGHPCANIPSFGLFTRQRPAKLF